MIQLHAPFERVVDLDFFIDLSNTTLNSDDIDAQLRLLEKEAGVTIVDGRVNLVLPITIVRHASVQRRGAVDVLRKAIMDAAARRRGLAVIVGAWTPNSECLGALSEIATCDPMIASVQPRFADADGRGVLSLPGGPEFVLPFAALPFMPEFTITPELFSALFVLPPRALLSGLSIISDSLEKAMVEMLILLRRRGFRNVVCNHIAVPFPINRAFAYPQLLPAIEGSNCLQLKDIELGYRWLKGIPERKLEIIMAGAFSIEGRPRLLLDCRGVSAKHNGTARAVLGFLEGFVRLKQTGFDIVLLALGEAARFHDFATRFSCFEIQLDRPRGTFFAAVLLNQPWSLHLVKELHRISSIVVFNMLDTIAWDIIYPAPEELGDAWAVMAQQADGLLFISRYSLERFKFRFKPSQETILKVTYLSLAADEIIPEQVGKSPLDRPFLLLIGNEYDHKDIQGTLSTLVRAFPFTKIAAIGVNSFIAPPVYAFQSGNVDDSEIHALMANAAAIIFPSHYEGFGLPVVEGLAHGTPVIVRDSPLWEEIASLSQNPELVIPFRDEIELVEVVGCALHGLHLSGPRYPVGPSSSQLRWSDCSQSVVDLIEEIAFKSDGRRWLARDALLGVEKHEVRKAEFPAAAAVQELPAVAVQEPHVVDEYDKLILSKSLQYFVRFAGLKMALFLISKRRREGYTRKRKAARRLSSRIAKN
jgi:glycosyltransferase involved in cell wall biosynthesis